MAPLVSVIVPFFSGKEWLDEALESVFNQTYKNFEVIVINDGSVENIDNIIGKYSGKIRYCYQKNRGASSARNKGIDLAEGEYIAFLDSDDLWNSNKTRTQIELMLKYDSDWSHTNYCTFDSVGNTKTIQTSYFEGKVYPLSFVHNPIATPTVIIKKELLDKNSNLRFPEGIKYGEDTIFWGQLSMISNVLAIDIELVNVRLRGSNSSKVARSQINGRANVGRFIKKTNLSRRFNFWIMFAYSYCIRTDMVFEKYPILSKNEFINRVLFFVPWCLLKIEKRRILKNR